MFNGHETITRNGYTFGVYLEPDTDRTAPWEEEDGHGPVRSVRCRDGEYPPKAPGERLLWRDRWDCLLYDWAEAIRLARRDGWDAPPYNTGTAGQTAERAVLADFTRLRDYCRGDWAYIGVCVVQLDEDGEPIGDRYETALWGVESDGEYWREVADELIDGELMPRIEVDDPDVVLSEN